MAYLPMDPAYPLQRIAYMLSDAGVRVLFTHSELAPMVPDVEGLTVVSLDLEFADPERSPILSGPTDRPDISSFFSASHLAYLIYTSGTTGNPKGVMVERGSLKNLCNWARVQHGVTRDDRALMACGVSFDATVAELWPYLYMGCTMYPVSDALQKDPDGLVEFIKGEAISIALLPTPLCAAVLVAGIEGDDNALRYVFTGGEKVNFRLHAGHTFELGNYYGPTENTVVSTYCIIDKEEAATAGVAPHIGKPLFNTQAYVLDPRMCPVPVGVPGELWVGGAQLARGYLNLPEKTSASFVPANFGDDGSGFDYGRALAKSETLYRTGDLTRFRADGNVVYMGRIDFQVKIRGHRIELGEIEAVLEQHAAVKAAVVVVYAPTPDNKQLAAYVVVGDETAEKPTAAALRDHVAAATPAYMVPTYVTFLDALPLTANGKTDRRALPSPTIAEGGGQGAGGASGGRDPNGPEYAEPRGDMEERLKALWMSVLGRSDDDHVSIYDDFFDLGGHSLAAMQLASRVRDTWNLHVGLAALFDHPTIAAFADMLEAELAAQSATAAAAVPHTPRNFVEAGGGGGGGGGSGTTPGSRFDMSGSAQAGSSAEVVFGTPRAIAAQTSFGSLGRDARRGFYHTVARMQSDESEGRGAGGVGGTGSAVDGASRLADDVRLTHHGMSFNQTSLWYHYQMEPQSTVYNVVFPAVVETTDFDGGAFEAACVCLARRHTALLSRYRDVQGTPLMIVDETVGIDFAVDDARDWDDAAVEDAVQAVARQPFVLEDGKLLRVRLLSREHEVVLVMVTHHIVCDLWSLVVMVQDVFGFYAALAEGSLAKPMPLGALAGRIAPATGVVAGGSVASRVADGMARPDSARVLGRVLLGGTANDDDDDGAAFELELDFDGLGGPVAHTASQTSWTDDVAAGSPDLDAPWQMDLGGASVLQEGGGGGVGMKRSQERSNLAALVGGGRSVGLRSNNHNDADEFSDTDDDGDLGDVDDGRLSIAIPGREDFAADSGAVSDQGSDHIVVDALAFHHYSQWQREWLSGPAGERLWRFWSHELSGALPTLNIPTDHPRPPKQTYAGAYERFELGADLSGSIRAACRALGCTVNMYLLAVYVLLLHRYTDQDDIIVGTLAACRGFTELERIVGFFANPVVLRTAVGDGADFEDLVKAIRRKTLEALAHQDYPFDLLLRRLQPPREANRAPVFQVLFVFEKAHGSETDTLESFAMGRPGARLQVGGVPLRSMAYDEASTPYDLQLVMWEDGEEIRGFFQYNTDLFEGATMARMASHYATLAAGALGEQGRSTLLGDLPLIGADERATMLRDWNDTAVDYFGASEAGGRRGGESDDDDAVLNPHIVPRLFEAVAAEVEPSRVAVTCGNTGMELTYAELNERANKLARFLRGHGCGPNHTVGILLPRIHWYVTAILAVWKAGGAYVPIDPEFPPVRMLDMLGDSQARIVITTAAHIDKVYRHNAVFVKVDEDGWEGVFGGAAGANVMPFDDNDPVGNLIYTSGTTGKPKGIVIPHRCLTNVLRWYQDEAGVVATDVAGQMLGPSFDPVFLELWPVLTAGGRVAIVPDAVRIDPRALLAYWTAERVTLQIMATPMGELVLKERWPADFAMKFLVTGGDKLSSGARPDHPMRLANVYGPSEATVGCTFHIVGRLEVAPPIGRPVSNTAIYIVDRRNGAVPVGVPGELLVGGAQIARGYLNNQAKTDEVFVANPFVASDPSLVPAWAAGTVYRTGDMAKWLPSGNVAFLGRVDFQVKIRGFRIELSEIEVVLGRHPRVLASVVDVFQVCLLRARACPCDGVVRGAV